MGSVQLLFKKGKPIYLAQTVFLSLSQGSVGVLGLKHRAYAQTGLKRPFNKFKIW